MALDTRPLSPVTAKPRIGVVTRQHRRNNWDVDYVAVLHIRHLQLAGAIPILIPRTPGTEAADYVDWIDGLLLVEGEDIGPEISGSLKYSSLTDKKRAEIVAAHPTNASMDPQKDKLEITLLRICLQKEIPVLGICRGCQLINVTLGGTLYFDVHTELEANKDRQSPTVKHVDYDAYDSNRHAITIVPKTPLSAWFPSLKTHVSSAQREDLIEKITWRKEINKDLRLGIRDVAPCLTVMARSEDGLVEAVYHPDHFDPSKGKFLAGVQFALEAEDSGARRMFSTFVTAAMATKIRRRRELHGRLTCL